MPQTEFALLWPDGHVLRCSSPSLMVHQHLPPGSVQSVAQVLVRSRVAMHEADARARRLHGRACAVAAATMQAVEDAAEEFALHELVTVQVVA